MTTLSTRRRQLIVAAMLISTFMAAVEVTVISTAMPTIVTRLGGFALFSWAFGIYVLMQAVMIPLYGRLADIYGRRPVYLVSAGLFLLGSLLCGLAWSMPALIVFRALQGIGGGGLAPLAITIIGDVTPAAERPRVIGYISGIWGVAALSGPLLGALFVNSLGWSFVFWLNLPLGVMTMSLIYRFLHETPRETSDKAIDGVGAVFMVIGIGGMMIPLVQGAMLDWPTIGGLLIVSLLGFYGFYRREQRAATPLLPLHLFNNPMLRAGNLSTMMVGAIIIAFTAFLPTWVQGVNGQSALASGLVIGSLTVAWAGTGMVAGPLLARYPHRTLAALAGAMIVIGSVGVASAQAGQNLIWLMIPCVLMGCGLGVSNLIYTVGVQSHSHMSERGSANGLFYFCRLLGQAIGAAGFGGVLNYGMASAVGGHEAVPGLIDPLTRATLAPEALSRLTSQLATALHGVFGLSLLTAVVIFGLAFLIPRKG